MKALIVVDVQNDFLPGGALAVPEGDRVIPVINRLVRGGAFGLVVATQDWHPPTHASFASNHPGRRVGEVIELNGLSQVLWPDHCVQGTRGAELATELDGGPVEGIFRKGTDPGIDSYSGLFDNGHRKATGLAGYLRERGVTDVYVCGLATDYCVKFTALDALQQEFRVHLVEDAARGVNLRTGDVERAVEEMRAKGVEVVRSDAIGAGGGGGIRYVRGDATRPEGPAGPKVIAHVCNDVGAWGRGFVKALSDRWPAPEADYREWHADPVKKGVPFELGQVRFVEVGPGLWVANVIGQHDIARQGKTADGLPPVRYEAIERGLARVAEFARGRGASVHMPRIGCGLAGGTWDRVGPVVERTLSRAGVDVTVYDLE